MSSSCLLGPVMCLDSRVTENAFEGKKFVNDVTKYLIYMLQCVNILWIMIKSINDHKVYEVF